MTTHEHSSKTHFTASLAETKPEQMSIFHFLALQTESALDKLQRHSLILFVMSLVPSHVLDVGC